MCEIEKCTSPVSSLSELRACETPSRPAHPLMPYTCSRHVDYVLATNTGVEGAAGKAGTSQSAVFTGTLGKCGGEKSLRIGEVGASGNNIVISAVDVGTESSSEPKVGLRSWALARACQTAACCRSDYSSILRPLWRESRSSPCSGGAQNAAAPGCAQNRVPTRVYLSVSPRAVLLR